MVSVMTRLKPITFDQLQHWIERNHGSMTVFTMGGTSYIRVAQISPDSIRIEGSNGNYICVSDAEWKQAMEYIKNIADDKDTWRVATYARPNVVYLDLNPNFGPSFPAICKAYWCYHKN